MVVAFIIITTIVVFIIVDLMLRLLLKRVREARTLRERERALAHGMTLNVSDEAPTLKRVEVENPRARILAVDDEEIILNSFRKILVLAGFSIDTVESGSEVLGLIRKNKYDFVFTDLKMPEMDGVEVTKAVKHLRPDIDVIVITGYASVETAVETLKYGAMDYIQKPFAEDELLEFIKTALIRRQDNLEKQMRHKIRVIRPGTRESKSKFELNVPAGVFVSPQHAWAKIELNGTVRVGLDDLIRKIFVQVDHIELPETNRHFAKGETLFSVRYGDFCLSIPSPISGRITSTNLEHAEHPEWLAIKPFELSWMCGLEPTNLAGELPSLRIGLDAINWSQEELDRFSQLSETFNSELRQLESVDTGDDQQKSNKQYLDLLDGFSKPFLQY